MHKLLTWNVCEGGHDATCGERFDLIGHVLAAEKPDVAVLVESGELGPRSAFGRLIASCGLRGYASLGAEVGYNVAILAREPAQVIEFEELATEGPNPIAAARVQLPPSLLMDVLGVHLHFDSAEQREKQAWQLIGRARAGVPTAILGDLNAVSHEDGLKPGILSRLPPAHVHRHVDSDGRLSTAAPRLLAESGLIDAFRHCNGPDEPGLTVPTDIPVPKRFGPLRLDYIWLTPGLAARLAECRVVKSAEARRASDHFPVVASLRDA